jgi:hypothetical protein
MYSGSASFFISTDLCFFAVMKALTQAPYERVFEKLIYPGRSFA